MRHSIPTTVAVLITALLGRAGSARAAEDWRQFKYDSRHSGNAADRDVSVPLGLIAAEPLTDAIFTAPAVADGRVYVVDGSGEAFCLDAASLRVLIRISRAITT